MKPGVISRPLL